MLMVKPVPLSHCPIQLIASILKSHNDSISSQRQANVSQSTYRLTAYRAYMYTCDNDPPGDIPPGASIRHPELCSSALEPLEPLEPLDHRCCQRIEAAGLQALSAHQSYQLIIRIAGDRQEEHCIGGIYIAGSPLGLKVRHRAIVDSCVSDI